jgi:CBS domain-containing protein
MLPVRVLIRNRPAPHFLGARATVTEAAKYLRQHEIGGAPVLDGDRLAGFLSERDIVFRVLADAKDPDTVTVGDVTTASIDATSGECERKMKRAHVRHLPILDRGKVVACISLRDILQSELRELLMEVHCLEEYVRGTSAG